MLKTPTELITESWHLYAKNWRKFSPFILMLFLPTVVLSTLGILSSYLYVYLPSSSLISNIIILMIFAASTVFAVWTTIALTRTMHSCLLEQQIAHWKETFYNSSNLIWPVILIFLLVALSVIGGTLLLIVPGIIFSVWYYFATYTVVLDGARGLDALRASKSLVTGRWWAIALRLAVITLVFGIISYVASYILTMLVKILPLPIFIESTLIGVLSSISSAIIGPLSSGATLILYKSAKENPVVQDLPTKI